MQIFVVGSERHVCNVPERMKLLSFKVISGSTKVVDFGTNRKPVCEFILMINSNLRPVFNRFGDIAGFVLPEPIFSYPTPIPAKTSFPSLPVPTLSPNAWLRHC